MGRFRDIIVSERTRVRYNTAVNSFLNLCGSIGLSPFPNLDAALSRAIEVMWHEGEPKSRVNYLLAGVQHFCPGSRSRIPEAWQLAKAWHRNELPSRAPPFSPLVVSTLCMFWLTEGDSALATCALLAFHCFLPTGEMAAVKKRDVILGRDGQGGVVHLRQTKSGARFGASESVTIEDPLLCNLLAALLATLNKDDCLLKISSAKFRERLENALRRLGLSGVGYRPYSLRRGGATEWYLAAGNMASTVTRGRWGSMKSARVYIAEGMGLLADIRLTASQEELFKDSAASLAAYCRGLGPSHG